MAGVGEEEVEYESDPEEAKLSLAMRRREASDDEEEGDDGERREKPPRRIDSDDESDGEGAAAEYDDDKDSEGEEDEEYEETGGGEVLEAAAVIELHGEAGIYVLESIEVQEGNQVEEEKKGNEPFAVPTAGAFYMHDDRFQDNAGGQLRRILGGRKLWELKDDRKWGHDKFEEMSSQERHYDERKRNTRNSNRTRSKNRGSDRGYQRGNRSKVYSNNNQNQAPKSVRGRGPRRYEAAFKNSSEGPPSGNKRSGKFSEKSSNATLGRPLAQTTNIETDPIPTRKHVFASSLSSASPPFYPSGSSSKEINLTQKRDVQSGKHGLRPTNVDENFSISHSNSLQQGEDGADFIGMDKLHVGGGKPSVNYHLLPSGSSSMNSAQYSQSRSQGRGMAPSGIQPTPPHNQVSRASPVIQLNAVQQIPVHSRPHHPPTQQSPAQQFGLLPGSGSESSSPPKAVFSINLFEPGEVDSSLESSKSRNALVGKVKGSVQAGGRSAFLYGGAQVMGASENLGSGDQNIPPTPAFLPAACWCLDTFHAVMPFGSQHRGGVGLPAVGMAFPGYVAQSQLGLGSSEMAWLPVLADAAGALGSSYCPPYIAVDGAYHAARPSGQASSLSASSKGTNTNKSNNDWKPRQRSELTNAEPGQRQNNARRYSQINFGQ